MKSADLKDRLTTIATKVRLLSFAARGLKEIVGDGDMQGIIDLAARIERELLELADETHPDGTVIPFGG